MITKDTWATYWAILCEHFNREKSGPSAVLYLEQVAAEMDDAGFIAATKYLVRTKSAAYGYFPCIADILDAAHGGVPRVDRIAIAGAEAFAWLYANPRYHPTGYTVDRTGATARFGAVAVRALDAVGGDHRLLHVTARELPFMRKEYIDAFRIYVDVVESGDVVASLTGAASAGRRLAPRRSPLHRLGMGAVNVAADLRRIGSGATAPETAPDA